MRTTRTLSICAVALLATFAESASAGIDCGWVNHGGVANAVTVSAAGTIYAIGTDCTSDGNCTFWKNTGGQSWVYEEGGGHGTSITTSDNGELWAINTLGVWRRNETTKRWSQTGTYPICGSSGGGTMSYRQVKGDNNIAVAGAWSTPWVIGSDGRVYYYGTSTCWVKLPALPSGTAISIAVDVVHGGNAPMVVSTNHSLYSYDGSWHLLPGGGLVYGVAAEGLGTGAQQSAIGLDRADYTYSNGWNQGTGRNITQIGRVLSRSNRTVVAGQQVYSFFCTVT